MLTATVVVVFNTDDQTKAMGVLERIVEHAEWASDTIEDIYIDQPPTPEGD